MMASAKRKWSGDEESVEQLAQARLLLEQLEQAKARLVRKLDERVELDNQIRRLTSVSVSQIERIANAKGEVESQKAQDVHDRTLNEILRLEEKAKEIPKENEIVSEIEVLSFQIKELQSQIQVLSTPTYVDKVLAEGSPSNVEKLGLYAVQMRSDQPLFECCFPAAAQPPLPVSLAHPAFGEFLDDFSDVSTPLDDDVCNFVVELCFDVLGRMQKFEDESEFLKAFNLKMEGFLGHSVEVDVVSFRKKKITTDSTVRIGLWWSMYGEIKLERGCTLAHALQSYVYHIGSLKAETELLPCFSVEVIGPTIRIGGFIFFKKAAWQPLTPFMNCFYTEYERTDMATLCRAMRALKKGVTTLNSYYNQAPSTRTIDLKEIPYPLQGRHSARIGNKLIFIVTRDDGERRIFKYCKQYGEQVHRSWAHACLAPILYDCKPIAGGWLEVEMEFLEDWIPSSTLLKDMDGAARCKLQGAISASLHKALAILIDDSPVAHGDMRPPNIMIKTGAGGGFDIKFIDFDWAGKVGVARYPPFMNTALPWHPDVGAGKELAQDHDLFWWTECPTGAISSASYLRLIEAIHV